MAAVRERGSSNSTIAPDELKYGSLMHSIRLSSGAGRCSPPARVGQRYFRFANYYLKKNKTRHPTDRHPSTLAQIPFAFRKISGSEAKLLWYLHRPGSGTGPNAYIPMVSGSTGFQTFRIISTPLGRTPKVVLGCSQAQKTSGAQKYNTAPRSQNWTSHPNNSGTPGDTLPPHTQITTEI